MSEFKGTKGEWFVKRYKHGFKLSGQSWEDFAKIYTISDGSDFDGKYAIEAEANAKLIACSPELLEAIIKVSDFIDKNENVNYWARLLSREVPNIKELIQKATTL